MRKTNIKKNVLAKILKEKYYSDYPKKECSKLAELFLKSDFPLNGITTYGKAFQFLDYLQRLTKLENIDLTKIKKVIRL